MPVPTTASRMPPAFPAHDAADPGFDPRRWRALASVTTDEPWQALPGHVHRSSVGRPWRGLMVWHQIGPLGDLYVPPVSSHTVLLRRSTPTGLVQRHGARRAETRWQPGEAVIGPAGLPSFWRSTATRDNVIINLAPAWVQRAAGGEVLLDSCFGRNDPVLAGFAQVLLGSLDHNVSLQPAFADNIAQAMALHLVENYARQARAPRASAGLSKRQMMLLEEAVAAALHERWPVARLAELVGLSPFHFSRAFKVSAGLPPHAWLNLRRMEAAARLVHASRIPLAEIAQAVGHPSAAHFSHAFRRHWGVSPSAYRRS